MTWLIDKKLRFANGRFYEAEICTATCNENLCLPNLISFAAWNSARITSGEVSGDFIGQTDSISENLNVSNLIGSLSNSSSKLAFYFILGIFVAI